MMEKTEQSLRKANSELKRLQQQKNDKKNTAQSALPMSPSTGPVPVPGPEEENEKR
jgi:hypothetical protein